MNRLTLPDGRSLSYQSFGEGLPLLCIHAPGIGSVNFSLQAPLSDSFQLIIPDLRGHGDSSPAKEPFDMADLARDLKTLVELLGIDRLIVLGYSQGGSVALECCLQFPQYIAGGILASSFSEVNELYLHSRFYMAQAMASLGAVSFLARSTASSHLDDKKEQERWIAHAKRTDAYTLQQIYIAGHHYNCTGRLRNIHVPMLLVYGRNDKKMHPYGKLLASHLPFADLRTVPNVSHQVITKAADGFNQLCREFARASVKQAEPV
ncbi:alpha/beta fold hydrolase [Brevibacillus sp. H7]|uniref:alpha/beta fold hydrolase n=1 Tax=Brevibacillus sp. H7 TaxID=3349138 RepID=UPI0037FFD77E